MFTIYCKAIVIKAFWYWHKDRHTDQWNRMENPEIKPHFYIHRFSTKMPKQSNEERMVFSIKNGIFNKWLINWKNWTDTYKRMKLGHNDTSYARINLKWRKDLNVS